MCGATAVPHVVSAAVAILMHISHIFQGLDIFLYNTVLVPVCTSDHWSLAVVCFPSHRRGDHFVENPAILHLDSPSECMSGVWHLVLV